MSLGCHWRSSGWQSGARSRWTIRVAIRMAIRAAIRVAIRVPISVLPWQSPIPKFCEVALDDLIRVDVDDLAERLRRRQLGLIRGNQEAISSSTKMILRSDCDEGKVRTRQPKEIRRRSIGDSSEIRRTPSQSSPFTCGKSTSRNRILYPQMSRCFSVCSRRCDGQSYCTIAT